jgi:hypothetical protein
LEVGYRAKKTGVSEYRFKKSGVAMARKQTKKSRKKKYAVS